MRLAAGAGALAGLLVGGATALSTADASLTTGFWSQTGGTLQWASQSNIVGFWQSLTREKQPCPGAYYDGLYYSNTVAATQRMQAEAASPPIAQTGVVDAFTWNSIQGAVDPSGLPRFSKAAGFPGEQALYYYYNGSSTSTELYWQGGSGLWKFKVPLTADAWINATSSRTMGSYNAC